jgi:hypothetical protein
MAVVVSYQHRSPRAILGGVGDDMPYFEVDVEHAHDGISADTTIADL